MHKGIKAVPGSEEWAAEEMQEPEHQKGCKGCRKMCKDASDFLGDLSREKAFGDPHRQKALYHHKQLDGIVGGGETPSPEGTPGLVEEGSDTDTEVGAMGESSLDDDTEKALRLALRAAQKNADDLEETRKQLAALQGR